MRENDLPGFWGPPTSSVDWCEDNYAVTQYIAEFFNSFSSFAMIFLGEAACYSIDRLQASLDRVQPNKTSLFRFKLAFRTITVVGIGSFLFHATLLHKMQMLDELPMLYSVLVLFFCLIESRFGAQPAWFPKLLFVHGVIVTGLVAFTSGNVQFFSFHASFSSLEIATLFLIFKVYQARKREYPDVKRVFELGIGLYAVAVTVWMTDLNFCEWTVLSLIGLGGKNEGDRNHDHSHGHSLIVKDFYFHAWWHILVSSGLFLLSTVILLDGLIVQGWTPKIEMKAGWLPVVTVVEDHAKDK